MTIGEVQEVCFKVITSEPLSRLNRCSGCFGGTSVSVCELLPPCKSADGNVIFVLATEEESK